MKLQMKSFQLLQRFRLSGRFYKKSLALVLLLSSLPAAVMGIASYYLGVTHIEREVAASRSVLLAKTASRLDASLGQLELAASQWSLDPRLDQGLEKTDFNHDYDESYELFRFLSLMKSAYPLLKQAELYMDQGGVIRITDTGGIEHLSDPLSGKRFQEQMDRKQVFFWDAPTAGKQEDLELVHKLPNYGRPYGLLVLRLDGDKLQAMVQDGSLEQDGVSMLTRNGDALYQPDLGVAGGEVGESLAHAALLQSRELNPVALRPAGGLWGRQDGLAGEVRSGRFQWEGDAYSIMGVSLTRLGERWTYASAAPLSSLTLPVILLSRSLLAVGMAGLLLSGVLAWFGSKRLYRPISRLVGLVHEQRLMSEVQEASMGNQGYPAAHEAAPGAALDEMDFLERGWRSLAQERQLLREELRRSYPELRSSFFMQLAQGHFRHVGEKELFSRLSAFGWTLQPGTRIAGMLLQVGESGAAGSAPQGAWQEQLMTFAAANVAEEYIREQGLRAEIVNFQDYTAALLIPCGPGWADPVLLQRRLAEAARELAATIRGLLKLEAVIAVGSPKPIGELHLQLPLLRGLLSYRDLREDCEVLELEAHLSVSGAGSDYPFDAERELLQAIRLGVDTERPLNRFFTELAASASRENLLREGALQLLGSLLHDMRESGQDPRAADGVSPYESLLALRTADAMCDFIRREILLPFTQRTRERKESELAVVAEQARLELEKSYCSDISLESCADLCGVSTYALSRAFKQAFDVNFSDYLAALRIAKSKELLLTTDKKVNEIALAVGYQPSYFNRLFRRLEGVTPGQYREQGGSVAG